MKMSTQQPLTTKCESLAYGILGVKFGTNAKLKIPSHLKVVFLPKYQNLALHWRCIVDERTTPK